MGKARNIDFIVDEKGRRKSVVMSYRTYMELLQDLADLRAITERREEEPEDLEAVIADLANAGRV